MPEGKELADQIGILIAALAVMMLFLEFFFMGDDEDDF